VTSLAKPHFAWPVPVAVHVVERKLVGESDSLMSYSLEACPRADGSVVVAHRNFKLERIKGRSAAEPQMAAAIAQLTPILSALPLLIVDASGALLEVEGIDEMVQRMQATMPASSMDRVAALLKNPEARGRLTAAIGERWQSWVGCWARFDPAKGAQQVVTDARPGLPSSAVTSHVNVDKVWAADRVGFSRRTPFEDQQAKALAAPLLEIMGAEESALDGYEISGGLSIEADLGWPNLQPNKVRTRKTVTVTYRGSSKSRVEEHDFTFGPWTSNAILPNCAKPLPAPG
jgi:hypothetical protein